MKVYAAWAILTLLVTAALIAVGDFTSTPAALGWAARMVLLFATADVAASALRRRRFTLAAVVATVAMVIVVHQLNEATQPVATAAGLFLILAAGAAVSLLLRDVPPVDPSH